MKCILVVDDNPQFLAMMAEMLEEEGYLTGRALNGIQALSLFQEQSWDLVICDMIMPEKDGVETILALRQLRSNQKIMAISGGGRYLDPQDVLQMAEGFGAKILSKPFSKQELLLMVKQIL